MKTIIFLALIACYGTVGFAQTTMERLVQSSAQQKSSTFNLVFTDLDGRSYISRDKGETWKAQSGSENGKWALAQQFPVKKEALLFTDLDGRQYVSYDTRRVQWQEWKPSAIQPTVSATAKPNIIYPSQSDGNGNYISGVVPQPADNEVVVSYQLSEGQSIVAYLVDTQGSIVSPIIKGHLDKGNHTVRVDVSQLRSGIYTFKVSTESSVISVPVSVVK